MNKPLAACFVLLSSIFLLCGVVYVVGLRINTTPSIPVGIYRLMDEPLTKGATVYFCPPRTSVFDMAKDRGYLSAGFCPGGYGHLMKKILAAKNDFVAIGKDGVQVNGRLLALSEPFQADGAGRALPEYEAAWVLGRDEFLLMSDSNNSSFDGRYFGSINRQHIEGVLRPIFTW
ncbi:MAG: conjugative transfer signal peptidase TraF [Methylococcaceae bacterium]|nr:conjugative transfer signal peptidase TraF [Methylococcaceae bacterium]